MALQRGYGIGREQNSLLRVEQMHGTLTRALLAN